MRHYPITVLTSGKNHEDVIRNPTQYAARMTSGGAAPGWYPDPSGGRGQRYFDGKGWGASTPPPPRPKNNSLKVILGVVAGSFILCGGCMSFIGAMGDDRDGERTSASSSASSPPPVAAPPTTTFAAPPAPADDPRDKVLFAELIGNPWFDDVDNAQMIETAHLVCTEIDEKGGGIEGKGAVLGLLMSSGFSMENATIFMAAAVKAYCPQHLAEIR